MNFTERWTNFRQFLGDVSKETAKVSWPDRDEVVGTTTVVVVTIFLFGFFLFLVDAAVTPLVNKLFSTFGS